MDNFLVSIQRFNEYAAEYTKRFMNIDPYLEYVDIFCSLIKKDNPRILELACGPGNFTGYIKKWFPQSEYLATDLAPEMLDIAGKQVEGVEFRKMDMRDVLRMDGPFDAIFCSFGLPFLSERDACKLIADCSSRLIQGGVLYISTMEGDESEAGFEKTSFSGDAEIFFNYHRENKLKEAFLENDLSIEKFKRQDYQEPDGNILTDMIFIGGKMSV